MAASHELEANQVVEQSGEAPVGAEQSFDAPEDTANGTGRTRLLLIRHGETPWNVERRMQGHIDTELTDNGRSQAQEVAQALVQLGIAEQVDAVVSSDLTRAASTAGIIARVCPQVGASRVVDAGLREVHTGDLQGRYLSEIQADVSEVVHAWSDGDFTRSYPGGENAAQVMLRGTDALRRAAKLGSCVVVVSHGGLLKWCAVHLELNGEQPSTDVMNKPHILKVLDMPLPNCCCSTVLYDHRSDTFQAEKWFDVIIGKSALGDTG